MKKLKAVRSLLGSLCLMLALASCSLKYRHQVEAPGTIPHWKYSIGKFIRYDGYKNVAGDLEVAITDYAKKSSLVQVQLVGVVHIADKDYYHQVQKYLDSADLVLFEGVKVQGRKVDFAKLKGKPGMYAPMAALLGLSEQMAEIDYNRKHFKHCDITLKTSPFRSNLQLQQMKRIFQIMRKIVAIKEQLRGILPIRKMEDYLKHFNALNIVKMGANPFQNMGKQIEPLLKILRGYKKYYPDNPYVLKLEKYLLQLKKAYANMGKMIVMQRNAYVLRMLKQELQKAEKITQKTKKPYRIAIFYGAAHNYDLEKRLQKLGYHPVKKHWLKAWKMNSRR
ncbi:MAG: hypothetical protein D6805_03700 [Planctomycetota bacterium]|nr:MAG: hypothetical protein D6805_03700 [Planctomycetota bacterium]